MTDNQTHIEEAIILAGGLGTRLKSVIGEYPKPLAPINGIPFLKLLFDYLKREGITRIVMAVGYKWEMIQTKFGSEYDGIQLIYSVENTRLDTGGAIKLALEKIKGNHCFVINGDTLFTISLATLSQFHLNHSADCSLALKVIENSDRYGSITVNEANKIIAFNEKKISAKSLINGGIYCLHKSALNAFNVNAPFSFEQGYLSKNTTTKNLYGLEFDGYFKDIGIPEDYRQFEEDIRKGED